MPDKNNGLKVTIDEHEIELPDQKINLFLQHGGVPLPPLPNDSLNTPVQHRERKAKIIDVGIGESVYHFIDNLPDFFTEKDNYGYLTTSYTNLYWGDALKFKITDKNISAHFGNGDYKSVHSLGTLERDENIYVAVSPPHFRDFMKRVASSYGGYFKSLLKIQKATIYETHTEPSVIAVQVEINGKAPRPFCVGVLHDINNRNHILLKFSPTEVENHNQMGPPPDDTDAYGLRLYVQHNSLDREWIENDWPAVVYGEDEAIVWKSLFKWDNKKYYGMLGCEYQIDEPVIFHGPANALLSPLGALMDHGSNAHLVAGVVKFDDLKMRYDQVLVLDTGAQFTPIASFDNDTIVRTVNKHSRPFAHHYVPGYAYSFQFTEIRTIHVPEDAKDRHMHLKHVGKHILQNPEKFFMILDPLEADFRRMALEQQRIRNV